MSGTAEDRRAREEKVLEAVRQWLPELTTPGDSVTITALDPEQSASGGAMFAVAKGSAYLPTAGAFVCRRGGGR